MKMGMQLVNGKKTNNMSQLNCVISFKRTFSVLTSLRVKYEMTSHERRKEKNEWKTQAF